MTEAGETETLQAQMEELQDQLETLRIGDSSRGQTKDVSLVAGIKEWTGESKGRPVHEFLTQIENLAKVSGWTSQDMALIVKAKIQGLALQYLHGREDLGTDGCPYEVLKSALVERFSDKLPDQYYYTSLQEAIQNKEEGAEEFGDRCRKMCQRTIRRVNDEETQRIINEEAERRLLAAYIHGLKGVVGQQVRYQMPTTMDQAVKVAVTVENVEKHRRLREGPRNIFVARQDTKCFRCAKPGHYARDCRPAPDPALPGWRTRSGPRGSWRSGPSRTQRGTRGGRPGGGPRRRGNRRPARPRVSYDEARPVEIQCYNCHGFGHVRRDCPRVSGAHPPPNEPGSAPRSPVSNRTPIARR